MSELTPHAEPSPACPGGTITAERTPDGVAFRPSRGHDWRARQGLLAFAVAFSAVLAVGALVLPPGWVPSGGAVLALVAFGAVVSAAVAVGAARYCASAAVPLVAEASGRVLYGPCVLLESGATPRLYVEERWSDGESGSWATFRVVASNRWGPVVEFPGPWFDGFQDRAVAVWFARQLAAAIGAEVRDADPGAAPGPSGQ